MRCSTEQLFCIETLDTWNMINDIECGKLGTNIFLHQINLLERQKAKDFPAMYPANPRQFSVCQRWILSLNIVCAYETVTQFNFRPQIPQHPLFRSLLPHPLSVSLSRSIISRLHQKYQSFIYQVPTSNPGIKFRSFGSCCCGKPLALIPKSK